MRTAHGTYIPHTRHADEIPISGPPGGHIGLVYSQHVAHPPSFSSDLSAEAVRDALLRSGPFARLTEGTFCNLLDDSSV